MCWEAASGNKVPIFELQEYPRLRQLRRLRRYSSLRLHDPGVGM
jgi:hypothetical protein